MPKLTTPNGSTVSVPEEKVEKLQRLGYVLMDGNGKPARKAPAKRAPAKKAPAEPAAKKAPAKTAATAPAKTAEPKGKATPAASKSTSADD